MNYLVEMYDSRGRKVYNFRQHDAAKALLNLAELAQSPDTYPFVFATCYLDGKPQWELEFKTPETEAAARYKAEHGWDGDCGGLVG